MRGTLRRIGMGLCLHILLSAFLLACLCVYQTGYAHTHSEPVEAVSLHIGQGTATVSVMTRSVTVPLPDAGEELLLAGMVLVDEPFVLWTFLLDALTISQ